jgi:hypothetical protein
LFSESNSRFLVEVPESEAAAFEGLFGELRGIPACTLLGRVTDDGRVRLRGTSGDYVVDSAGAELKQAWKQPLAWD